MAGNIDVHFEEVGNAVTDLHKYLENLKKAGYDKVCATNTGSFTQYEDVKYIIKKIKKEQDPSFDMTIVPAIQCYFEGTDAVLNLVAKNTNGYHQLSSIITESNKEGYLSPGDDDKINKQKPVVYMEILEKFIKKGDVALISATDEGYFYKNIAVKERDLLLQRDTLEQTLSSITKLETEPVSYQAALALHDHFLDLKAVKKPTKKALDMAQKYEKNTGDNSDVLAWHEQMEEYEQASAQLDDYSDFWDTLQKAIKQSEKTYRKLQKVETQLHDLQQKKERGDFLHTYQQLEALFGKENIYFEVFYHDAPNERQNIASYLDFIEQTGNDNLIAGNDTRIGVSADDPTLEDEKYRLTLALSKLNSGEYTPLPENISQFCIKDEQTLKEGLLHYFSEEKTNQILKDTQSFMESLEVLEPEKTTHYPVFCENENDELEKRCLQGLAERFPDGLPNGYQERLDYELNVIKTMGFSSYHLIVQDYLEYARLLGYLTPQEVETAPLTIEELKEYLKETNNPQIGIGIGPGRGSAAGSLVCFALGITDIDPIKNGLLFERFLNPERVSMPDIDSDFRPDVRFRARDYVTEKYGHDNVCEIVTKSYEQGQGAVRDIAKLTGEMEALGKGKTEADQIRKRYADIGNILAKKTEKYADFEDVFANMDSSEFIQEEKEILSKIPPVYGFFSGYGQHAAGVIISKDSVAAQMPLMWSPTSRSMQTQCSMAVADDKGYLKMDFLGLRNLKIITDAVRLCEEDKQIAAKDISGKCQNAAKRETFVLNDPETIKKVFCNAKTQGIFQFEAPAMRKYLQNFQPESFEDIVLLNAANRPGPQDFIPEMTAIKWYRKDPKSYESVVSRFYPKDKYPNLYPVPKNTISSKNEALNKILAPTYGCPIYQEQIMQIFQQLGGYSLGRADEVRRAMSKKKEDIIAGERKYFIHGNADEIQHAKEELERLKEEVKTQTGAKQRETQQKIDTFKIPAKVEGCMALQGMTEAEGNDLFDKLMPFAKYGFNKSHACAYSVVAMETAYLKAHAPMQFYCSALNNIRNRDDLIAYISEMSSFGISLKAPEISMTQADFTIDGNQIAYPPSKAKGFAKAEQKYIPYKNLTKFIQKNLSVTQAKIMTLISMGMFDSCFAFSDPAKQQLEVQRCGQNKALQKQFVKDFYKTIHTLVKTGTVLKSYKEENKPIDNTYEKNQKEHQKALDAMKASLPTDFTPVHQTFEQIIAERREELDLLSYNFSAQAQIPALEEKYGKGNTFNGVNQSTGSRVDIPCMILDVDATPKVTKGGTHYHNVTLMDREGTIAIRRFAQIPSVENAMGVFAFPTNPYFICDGQNRGRSKDAIHTTDPKEVKKNVRNNIQSFTISTSPLPRTDRNSVMESQEKAEDEVER